MTIHPINRGVRRAAWLATSLLTFTFGELASAQPTNVPYAGRLDRTGRREFSVFYRDFTAPSFTKDNVTLPGLGTKTGTFNIHDSATWGMQFGYNLSENLNVNMEFAYGEPNYSGSWGTSSFHGQGDLFNMEVNAEYNLLKKAFTPFVGAGIGWQYFDTNIPQGSPDVWCWWDYYWGYVCTASQSTHTSSEFTWNLSAGLRWDFTETLFAKASAKAVWANVGAAGTEVFPQYYLIFGWKW